VSDWHPEGVDRYRNGRPREGEIVALARRAWEVMHISDADPTPEEQERLDLYVAPWRDQMRPYRVTLRRLHGPKHEHENSRHEVGFRIRVGAHNPLPGYKDGRVPLCSCCGHPWPCLEADQQRFAEREMKSAEKALNLMPGCCPACEEPVTSRQRSITFGGPNVRNPLADGPTYHLRRKCYGAAASYEETWVNAEPGRARSLLTLRCEGTLIVHGDGTGECFGANGSDCPSIYAQHRGYSACYMQSHGCGQDCARAGHPGTRLAGRPDNPRAVTRSA
jgi:hypothetical protein